MSPIVRPPADGPRTLGHAGRAVPQRGRGVFVGVVVADVLTLTTAGIVVAIARAGAVAVLVDLQLCGTRRR